MSSLHCRCVSLLLASVTFLIWTLVASYDDPHLTSLPYLMKYKETPFTGILYQLHPNHLPQRLSFFWKGKKYGYEIHWYEDGQRQAQLHFKEGLEDGDQKAWYPDGQVQSFKQFVNGKPHGEIWVWGTDGRVRQYSRFEMGQEVSFKSWTGPGKPFYNYVYQNNSKVGMKGGAFCKPLKVGIRNI